MASKTEKSKGLLRIKPIVLLAFCVFMYMPTLKSFPILSAILTYFVPLAYIVFNYGTIKGFISKNIKLITLALVLLLVGVLVPIVHNTGDMSYYTISTYFFRKALVYLALVCLVIKKHGGDNAVDYLLCYFAYTHVAHVAVTLMFVLIPQTQNFWFSIFQKEASTSNLFQSYGYTFRIGWQGFAGFRLTIYCTLSAIFGLFLRYKKKIINIRDFSLIMIGNILGNMFYGRSGIIVTVIVSLIAIVYWNRKMIARIIMAAAAAIVLLLCVVMPLKDSPVFHDWFQWMSSPIMSFFETGDFNNTSFDRLKNMNSIELTGRTLLIGDGYYMENGHYYKRTDSGYMRNILYWGVIGATLSYFTMLYSVLSLKKLSRLLIVQVLIMFVVFEYKGAMYYELPPIMFAISVALMQDEKKKILERNAR